MNYLTEQKLQRCMLDACVSGDIATIEIYIKHTKNGKPLHNMTKCAETLINSGHIHIAKWFICAVKLEAYDIDYCEFTYRVCKNGYLDLLEIIIKHMDGSRDYDRFKKYCWKGACEGGSLPCIILLIEKDILMDPDEYITHAAYGGNMDVVMLILSRIEGYNNTNDIITVYGGIDYNVFIFNECLDGACAGGHKHIIKFALDNGADNYNESMCSACAYGQIEFVKLMIHYGANVININEGFRSACGAYNPRHKNKIIEIIKLMIDYGADDYNGGMRRACREGYIDIINIMIGYGANDYNGGMLMACEHSRTEVVNYMITLGSNAWNEGLRISWGQKNIHLMNLMVSKGATNLELLDSIDINNFKLSCHHSKHIGLDPINNNKCLTLLRTYPLYVLLGCKIKRNLRDTKAYQWFGDCSCVGTNRLNKRTHTDEKNQLKRLPQELFRLLHQFIN